MRSTDLLRFDFQVLSRHRFRTVMMLIAMSIGVAAVNVLTGLGEGAKSFVLGEFNMLGKNTLIILPGKKETVGGMPPITGEAPREITLQDAESLLRVPGVVRVAPLIVGIAQVSYGDRNRDVMIAGTTASALGQWLKAGDRRFRVIGILDMKGQALGTDMNDVMIISVASAQALFNQEGLFRVMVEGQSPETQEKTKQRLIAAMAQRHDGEEDVTIITQDSILSAFNKILDTMTLAVAGIGAISLLVAGILIMNVTLISVTQRTREIGLLKAIGAADRDVLAIFLTEAVLMAAFGAALGLTISEAALFAGRLLYPDVAFHTPTWALLLSVSVAMLTALIFAWGPSRRAARLEPVNALQDKH